MDCTIRIATGDQSGAWKASWVSQVSHMIFFPVSSSSGLLDVGSSYGAWDSLPKSLALDLAPAAPSVWRANFLQLQIEEMEMEEIGT